MLPLLFLACQAQQSDTSVKSETQYTEYSESQADSGPRVDLPGGGSLWVEIDCSYDSGSGDGIAVLHTSEPIPVFIWLFDGVAWVPEYEFEFTSAYDGAVLWKHEAHGSTECRAWKGVFCE